MGRPAPHRHQVLGDVLMVVATAAATAVAVAAMRGTETTTTVTTTTATTITTTTGPTGPVASLGASLGAFSINPEWGTSHLLLRVESISDNDTPSSSLYSISAQKITLILSAKVFILYHFADRSGWRVLTNG